MAYIAFYDESRQSAQCSKFYIITFIFSLNIHGVRLTKQLVLVFLVWVLVSSGVYYP